MLDFRRVQNSAIRGVRLWQRRGVALGLAAFLVLSLYGETAVLAQQGGSVTSSQPQSQSTAGATQGPGSAADQSAGGNRQPDLQTTTPEQQQGGTSEPLGTAVAPYEKGIGVAASRPAGAVLAPAKQRRTRSFLIRVGLLVGAGVAVGTVVALSSASPSQPH